MNSNWSALWTETKLSYPSKLLSDIFQATDRGHNPGNRIWNDHIGVVLLLAYSSIYSKVEVYETKNKMHADIEYWIKNNGSSLHFSFISLPSPAAKNWVGQLSSAALNVHLQKCHIHRCSLSPNFLLMASTLMASTKYFHFRHNSTFLCVWRTDPYVLLVSYISYPLYLGASYLWTFSLLSHISDGAPYISRST